MVGAGNGQPYQEAILGAGGRGRAATFGGSLVLPGHPREVGTARRWLAGLLGEHPAAGDALVVLSELAGNAVVHSGSRLPGGTFSVLAEADAGSVRIEVKDRGGAWRAAPGGAGEPAAGDPAAGDGQGGRGLAIVAALSSDWGVTGDSSGRTA